MSQCHRFVLIAASIAALVPRAAQAQKDVASCKPVLAAVEKLQTTSYHAYTTRAATLAGGKPAQLELIAADGQNYVLYDGTWKRSPMDQVAMAKQEQENIQNTKALSCHRLREESVGGVPAVVYGQHSENEDTKSDGQVWVATATGLILQVETDMSMTDGSGTDHMVTRYEYRNVQAPAGVK
jgi:hypothetical protein